MVGGSPVISMETLFNNASFGASALGANPTFSRVVKMKWSMGFLGLRSSSASGTLDLAGAMKDQCFLYFAPWAIHFLMISISFLVKLRLEDGGGITSAVSGLMSLAYNADCIGSPGTITCFEGSSFRAAKAPSSVSKRRLACLLFASGPWHLKHRSDSIGLTWKLKSTTSGTPPSSSLPEVMK